ncbi:MAG: MATE family efflux transporter [Polyangiales bacterium]
MVLLAWPIAVTMLGDTAMGLVDTKLVSNLGANALGGVGIATTLMFLNYAMVFGLMRGVKVRTAHAVGQMHRQYGIAYVQAGLTMALGAGVLVWLLGRDGTWALQGLGIDPATIPYARDFLAARTWGGPSACMASALIQYRQGLGDVRTPMLTGIFANILNAVLAYALIHGVRIGALTIPAFGVRGAGYGTAIAETCEVAILLGVVAREVVVSRKRALHPDAPSDRLPLSVAFREVCQIGVPTGLQFGLETLAFTAFTAIIGELGAIQIAAHQVALAIIRTSFLPGIAVAEAASVLVGRALGAGNLGEADRVTRSAIAIAAAFMSLCGVVFAVEGTNIARQFAKETDLIDLVRKLLLVAVLFQTLDAINMVLRGALRGAKDVKMIAVIGITVVWFCVPGAALVFGRIIGWGALGGWIGFGAETAISATLFWFRWTRGSWRASYALARTDFAATATAPQTG